MRGLNTLRTRPRLVGAFFVIAAIAVAVAVVGYLGIRAVGADTATLYGDRLVPARQLASFSDSQRAIGIDLSRSFLIPGDSLAWQRDIEALVASADESLRQYSAGPLPPAEEQQLPSLKSAWAAYRSAVAQNIAVAGTSRAQALQGIAAGGTVDAAENALRGVVTDLVGIQAQESAGTKQQADQTLADASWAVALAGLLGVVLAFGLLAVLSRSISGPLSRITGAARAVADGTAIEAPPIAEGPRSAAGTLEQTFGFMTDRLQGALEELRRSEERFRQVAESAGEWIWEVDRELVYTYSSPVVATMLGYHPEELVGRRHSYDLAVGDAGDESKEMLLDAMIGRVPLRGLVHRNAHRDGSTVIVETSGIPMLDERGDVVGYRGADTDVTKRIEVEEELSNSRARFVAVVESAMDAVIAIDGRERIVIFNRAAEEMFGRAEADVVGQDFDCLLPERFRGPPRGQFLLSPRAGGAEVIPDGRGREIVGLRSNGEEFPAEASISHLESATPPFSTVILRDVSEQKRVHDALRQSEERYRRIAETVTDYVYTVAVQDGKATGTVHGPGCAVVTGYSSEEFAADPHLWISMVAPEDRETVIAQAQAVLTGERFAPLEHRIVRKDGITRWVRNTPVPQLGADGTLRAYDGLIQDITERRTLRLELLQAQKMESIGRLAGGVAHDFNNLLTVILGNADFVRSDLSPDHPALAGIDEIHKAGERAASLTRQLLAFASKQVIAPVRLDLSAVVADSERMLRRLLGEDIEVITDLEPALDTVEADPGQLQQLLVNLAVNSRDAMPQGGKLVIETANETITEDYAATHPEVSPWRYVRLSVADTGFGMSEEVREHLFEPFFTTKEPGKGTGLGLATCHGIVKQIGGHIRVYSEPGQGTTFRILLPAIDAPAKDGSAEASAGPTPSGTETVLVVEDEPAVRRLAVLGLRAHGYSVLEAADGFKALELARTTPGIELLVSDVVMPGMNGPELIDKLRELSPATRVLLMSGHAEAAILPREPAALGLAFLPKPFTPERLARKVREVLDGTGERLAAEDETV